MNVKLHGYGPYTRGCRCEACKAAKAKYMRGRRSVPAGGLPPETGLKHGTRFAYEERGCRCEACRDVQIARHRKEYLRRITVADPDGRCTACGYLLAAPGHRDACGVAA